MIELSDAENARLGISRADQDAFAAQSHARAAAATEAGRLAEEIRRRRPRPRPRRGHPAGHDARRLGALRPAAGAEGTITAGNASQLSDGGAAGVVTTAGRARAAGHEPLAEIVGRAVVAGPDSTLHLRPAEAAERLLARHGLTRRRRRPVGDQRGLRGRRARVDPRARHRPGTRQRGRRRRRARAPARRLRLPPPAHARPSDAPQRRLARRRDDVRRRRTGRGGAAAARLIEEGSELLGERFALSQLLPGEADDSPAGCWSGGDLSRGRARRRGVFRGWRSRRARRSDAASRQTASTSYPSMMVFVSGRGRPWLSMKVRKRSSSSLRVGFERRLVRRRIRRCLGASFARVAVEEGGRAVEVEDLGLVQGSVEGLAVDDGGEIEERSGGGGDGDALVDSAFIAVGERRSEYGALCGGGVWLGVVTSMRVLDVTRRLQSAAADWWLSTAPGPAASTAAIHRACLVTARGALRRTPRDEAGAAGPCSSRRPISRRLEPERHQLPPRHYAVLPLRQGRDRGIEPASVQFGTYAVLKCVLAGHALHRARRIATAGAWIVTSGRPVRPRGRAAAGGRRGRSRARPRGRGRAARPPGARARRAPRRSATRACRGGRR